MAAKVEEAVKNDENIDVEEKEQKKPEREEQKLKIDQF